MKKKNYVIGMTAALILIFGLSSCGGQQNKADSVQKKAEKEQEKQKTEELPYEMDEGKLVLNSVFQSSITNPDCGNEEAEDIASIEVKNQSDEFLTSADITVVLEDKSTLFFRIEDIPAGKTVWAFETKNTEISENPVCSQITCKAKYEDGSPIMEGQVSAVAEGTNVVVQNLTEKGLSHLEINFHCLFDEDLYYGGTSCTYPIDEIQAGESVSLDVEECYLGEAQVVRITQGDEK